MNVENVYKLHEILNGRRTVVSKQKILEETGWSESKFKRTREYMQNFLGAEIEYYREQNGYLYVNENYELPGFWFGSDELLALVSLEKLVSGLNIGVLQSHLLPFKSRIDNLLKNQNIIANNLQRIRILPINARISNTEHFKQLSAAVTLRNAVRITYHARGKDQTSNRNISPQRLLHYRDNWYLDAWCHLKNELRTFALDRIKDIQMIEEACLEIANELLDAHFKSGYGIFAGEAKNTATLIFSQQRARWVADEEWHPDQKSTWLPDGRYQLEVPYADERELIMDVMRHLPEVEITAPNSLKNLLISYLNEALKKHQ